MLPSPATAGRPDDDTADSASRAALRAGDADRKHAAALLRRHLDDGRLTVEEFTERLEGASTARTFGDLAHALRELPDLPAAPPAEPPPPDVSAAVPADQAERTALTRHLVVYLLANGLLVLMWLLSGAVRGDLGPFWPAWILLLWGIAPLLHTCTVMARTASRQRHSLTNHLRSRVHPAPSLRRSAR
jgi:hypothetical protein